MFLTILQNSQENTWTRISFNKVAGLSATLWKKRLWHMCFLVNFAKFLISFLQNPSEWLLLQVWSGSTIAPTSTSVIYPSTLTNVHFKEEDWVLWGKKQLWGNRNCILVSRVESWWVFLGQSPKSFWLF